MRKNSLIFLAINLVAITCCNLTANAQSWFVGVNSNYSYPYYEIKYPKPNTLGSVLRLTGGGDLGAQCAFEMATFEPSGNPPNFRILATDLGGYASRVEFQNRPISTNIGDPLLTRLTIADNGFIGIGTATPGTNLHVEGSQYLNGNFVLGPEENTLGYKKRLDFGMNSNSDPEWISRYNAGPDASELRMNISDEPGTADRFVIGWTEFQAPNTWHPVMHVNASGIVGIGATVTNETGYKLFVEDGIRSRKVKVDAATWADYVFHANYRLRPLSEVEQYIKENGHLPEVPSEEDVKKEGINLGDNQAILLKKVEELTLYVIEQNKKQENQEKLIQEQHKLLQAQQQRLEELEKQVKEKH